MESKTYAIALGLEIECGHLGKLRGARPALRRLPGTESDLEFGKLAGTCRKPGALLQGVNTRKINAPVGTLLTNPYPRRPCRQRRGVRSHGFTVTAAP